MKLIQKMKFEIDLLIKNKACNCLEILFFALDLLYSF